jgi:hypothetical protein
MRDQHGRALSFGPFERPIENRLLTNRTKFVPLGAYAMEPLIVPVKQEFRRSDCLAR